VRAARHQIHRDPLADAGRGTSDDGDGVVVLKHCAPVRSASAYMMPGPAQFGEQQSANMTRVVRGLSPVKALLVEHKERRDASRVVNVASVGGSP
jgi:hypothetical protein